MTKSLDVILVRTFITVAENTSMTVTANALHLTQGAINQQIKRPKNAFECRLFEYDGRRLELTHTGEQFLGRAKRLLALDDEIWVDVAARPLQGPMRLGVSHDLVDTVFPPIFKAFTGAWPPVELTIVCSTSPELTERIARGELDVAVIKAPMDEATDECLCVRRLVWVGPHGGNVRAECPLPLSMVDESCASRVRVLKALGEHGIEWRTVFESGNIGATAVTVRTGLAIAAWLTPAVPAGPDILGPEAGLPELPMFVISLLLPTQNANATALALARCVHDGFSLRQRVGERRAAWHVISDYRPPPSICTSPLGASSTNVKAGRAASDNSTYRFSGSEASHPSP